MTARETMIRANTPETVTELLRGQLRQSPVPIAKRESGGINRGRSAQQRGVARKAGRKVR